jgi:PAS domain S-box-containing protein
MDQTIKFLGRSILHTDIVRVCVIISLSLCCILITALSLERQIGPVYTQLFYFPIIYATYFYPRRGLYLAGACALAFELLSYFYVYPSTVDLISTTAQAILFILVAVVVSAFTENLNTSEARYRSIFESTLMGIVLFDQNTFKIRLTNECVEQMLGYTREELRSIPFSDLFSTPEEKRVFFERLGSSADVSNFQTRFVMKSSDPFWVALSWRRVSDNMVSTSIIDINSRKLAEQAAGENLARYQQVTESSPTGIVILRNEKIAYTNPSFTRFSGYSSAELAGKDLLALIREEDRAEFFKFISAAREKAGHPEIRECRFITKSGEVRLGALFFTPIVQQGTPALLINLVDITEREKLKEQIQKDTEMRHGMISTVAHELRTPLQPIMGYLNLLTQDPATYGVTEETRAILDRCAKSVDRESQIINQMLELSVLDTGRIPLSYSVIPVSRLLNTIVESGGYAAKADLVIDAPPGASMEADESKLSVVIDSMLSNAVNYSKPPRKIRVAYQFSPAERMHRISIRDNGMGITNSQLDEIFEPFTLPGNGKTARKPDRVGLSLSIAKKYVQMHGGFISVDSIVNLGSTFTIHIPQTPPAPAETSHDA